MLAKLNTRGTTTVEAIREMVSIVTGCDGAVVEHFSQYAFTVIVYMLFEGVFPDLSELIRQIDEIKPAHLTFDIVGAFRPIGIENKVEVSLYRLKIRSRFANTRGQRVVRFDGEADFDGSILFNQSFSGITFPAMSIRTGFPIREKINGTLTMDSWYASVSYTHLDVYKRQTHGTIRCWRAGRRALTCVARSSPSLSLIHI